MTSQPGWQTITVHILENVSRSKGNQTMRLGQLIEQLIDYIKKNFFFKNFSENEAGRLVPDLFFIF